MASKGKNHRMITLSSFYLLQQLSQDRHWAKMSKKNPVGLLSCLM